MTRVASLTSDYINMQIIDYYTFNTFSWHDFMHQRLARRLCRAAARCGCRTTTAHDVYVPSAARGGVGSSSHAPTGSQGICTEDEDDDHEGMDQGPEELGLPLLEDAPWTQPTQQVGTRWRRPPDPYTLGTHTLGQKGKVGLGDSEGFGRFYVRCFHGLWWTCRLLLYIIMDCMDYYYRLLYHIIMYCISYYGVYGILRTLYAFRLLIYIVWDECHIYLLMTYINVIFVFQLNQKTGKTLPKFSAICQVV
jgi:hypothetical protein